MKLYHGTNTAFSKIDTKKCRPRKDFGRGFYLTDIRKQALAMAERRCEFEGTGTPIVLCFELDERCLTDGSLRVKRFESVSEEWAQFIIANRRGGRNARHEYDVVIGPVADDGVVYQINRYFQHIIDMPTLVRELSYKKLNSQYFFGTEKAISKLKLL